MPVSRESLVAKANGLLSGSNSDLELLQLSALADSNTAFSVATINDLPDASLNKGRFIFVSDIGGYRYSDGIGWTNNYDTTCIIEKNIVYGWGQNACGDLGSNDIAFYSSPVQEISSSIDWCLITNGSCVSVGIKTDGTLWRWGILYSGENVNRSSPAQEQTSSTNWCFARQGGGGVAHGHGIKTDGTLWSWGYNSDGQLGTGDNLSIFVGIRQEITSSTNWINVAPGGNHTSAVKSDGTLWNWGCNTSGEAAINSIVPNEISSPVQEISSSTNWCATGAGGDFSSAIKTDGTIWSWGRQSNYVLGIGESNLANKSSPTQEASLSTNWSLLSSGGSTTRTNGAIKTDGSLWMWGAGFGGVLGNNSQVTVCTPIQEITSSTNWCLLDTGVGATVALKTDGSFWMWGENQCGMMQTYGENKSSPVQEITSSTDWIDATAGLRSILGIRQVIKGFDEP